MRSPAEISGKLGDIPSVPVPVSPSYTSVGDNSYSGENEEMHRTVSLGACSVVYRFKLNPRRNIRTHHGKVIPYPASYDVEIADPDVHRLFENENKYQPDSAAPLHYCRIEFKRVDGDDFASHWQKWYSWMKYMKNMR
jgi:hypothetical protein